MKGYVRWGEATFRALSSLKALGVNLVVDTASKKGGIWSIPGASEQYGLKDFFGPTPAPLNKDNIPVIAQTKEGEEIYAWGNIISGSSGYDKPGYLQAYMDAKGIKPQLVIFMDDSAHNIIEMRAYFEAKGVPFMGIHVPLGDLELPRHQKIRALIEIGDSSLAAEIDNIPGEPGEGTNALKIRNEGAVQK